MKFINNLQTTIESYNTFRETMGYQKYPSNNLLNKFIKYLYEQFSNCEEITQEMIDDYLSSINNSYSNNTYNRHVITIKKYLEYLSIIGFPTFLIDKSYFLKTTQYIPYLLTYTQLQRLFNALDLISPVFNSPNREYFIPLAFRVMYCCGMRPQEVSNLKIKDVNLSTGEIYIQNSKNGKSRHIYMSEDLLMMYRHYFEIVAYNNKEYVFEYPNGIEK